MRPLGIHTIVDRVVQTVALLVLEPISESDLAPEQHAHRQDLREHDAVREVHRLLNSGHTQVVVCPAGRSRGKLLASAGSSLHDDQARKVGGAAGGLNHEYMAQPGGLRPAPAGGLQRESPNSQSSQITPV